MYISVDFEELETLLSILEEEKECIKQVRVSLEHIEKEQVVNWDGYESALAKIKKLEELSIDKICFLEILLAEQKQVKIKVLKLVESIV